MGRHLPLSLRTAHVFGVVLAVALGALFAGDLVRPQGSPFITADSLTLPDVVEAGEIVSIEATSTDDVGFAEVIVHVGYGQLRFEMAIVEGQGRLDLPAAVTQHAGLVQIESGTERETLQILPGEVTTLIAPLVGPRTIVANGNDETLAVLLPTDRFGNQVADGTETTVMWEQPGDVVATAVSSTADGMAWTMIASGEVAGPTIVAATTRDGGEVVRGAAVRIDEVPGTVRSITLRSSSLTGRADGRSVLAIETDELVDAFGNVLADGTSAHFVFDGPSGQGVVTGTVQNGIARIELTAPTEPGRLVGYLDVHGVQSNEVEIDFESAISGFEVRLDTVGEETVLRVENALDPSGAFIADGTTVTWGELVGVLRRGSAEIWIPAALADVNASVEILGLVVQPETERP